MLSSYWFVASFLPRHFFLCPLILIWLLKIYFVIHKKFFPEWLTENYHHGGYWLCFIAISNWVIDKYHSFQSFDSRKINISGSDLFLHQKPIAILYLNSKCLLFFIQTDMDLQGQFWIPNCCGWHLVIT